MSNHRPKWDTNESHVAQYRQYQSDDIYSTKGFWTCYFIKNDKIQAKETLILEVQKMWQEYLKAFSDLGNVKAIL